MRYPWANTALLVLLLVQLLTGFLGLISGAENLKWILWLHGIGGYAVVVILVWKTLVIFDAFNRIRRVNFSRVSFLFLAALVLLILSTGVVWLFAGNIVALGFSLMTIHALAALALVALFVWHVVARFYIVRVPASRDRRAFLRSTGTLFVGFFLWRIVEPALTVFQLPGASRRFTGSYEITGKNFPQVIWLSDSVAPVAVNQWRLEVRGKVERELSLAYDELARAASDIVTETIDCTGGWYSTQEWRGVNLGRLLDRAGIAPNVRSVVVESVSGYARRFGIAEARGFLIALNVAGESLTHGHGAPARLIAKDHRGFEWVKWVAQIRVETTPEFLQSPLPLQ